MDFERFHRFVRSTLGRIPNPTYADVTRVLDLARLNISIDPPGRLNEISGKLGSTEGLDLHRPIPADAYVEIEGMTGGEVTEIREALTQAGTPVTIAAIIQMARTTP